MDATRSPICSGITAPSGGGAHRSRTVPGRGRLRHRPDRQHHHGGEPRLQRPAPAPDQEILTTEQDYYVTHEASRLGVEADRREGPKISLYEQIEGITADQIVDRIAQAVTPATRVLALTWVHSSTGLKLPLRGSRTRWRQINAERDGPARVLLCVDGVHGFGSRTWSCPTSAATSSWRAATSGCSGRAGRASSPGRSGAGSAVLPDHPELH